MASSYTTNFSIEKMGTGDQSGTWGTTTNHNFDILDRIASYKAVAITTNADTHTLTVREASPGSGTENLQDGMYRVIKFTGALDSNCTVTIAPNSAAAFFVFINATTDSGSSGPYSLIFTQGSGANVTIENGKSAVVYADGAGSGAAVVNALDKPLFGTVSATGDTAAGDAASMGYTSAEGLILTGQGSTNDVTIKNDADQDVLEIPTGTQDVTVQGTISVAGDTSSGDSATIGYTAAEGLIITGQGSTNDVTIKNDADTQVCGVPTGTDDLRFPDNAQLQMGTGGDLYIYHNSADNSSYIAESGSGHLYIQGTNFYLRDFSTNEDMLTGVANGAVTLFYDASSKLATSATGVSVTGTLVATTDTDTSNTGSVTLDFGANQNFVLTLTGNVTLANPSTEQVGQAGVIVFIQDGTGSRTLSLGTDYETAAGAGITLSTAASAVDVVPYFVKASGSIQLGAPQLAFS